MAWFSELFLPWLLERLKDVADSERAREGGNSGGVILFLASVILAALLSLALIKVYDLQGEKIEASIRLETTREKADDLKNDNDELEKQVDELKRDNALLKESLNTPVVCPTGPTTQIYKRSQK